MQFYNKPNLNIRYKKNDLFCNHDFIVKDFFKDDKKLISYYFYRRSVPVKTTLLEK